MKSLIPAIGIAARGLTAIMVTLPIAAAAGLVLLHASGYRLLGVQTGSMMPAIRPGDALVIRVVSSGKLYVGDIISYRNPRDPAMTISHRLLAIDRRTGWLTTAGDTLRAPDPAFPPDLVIGRAAAIAPRLGLVLDTLRRPLGLGLAVYLPAILIVMSEANRLARAYARPFYSARLEACDLKPSGLIPTPSSTART